MPKIPNYRLAKRHRNYTVEEAARLFDVHRNTVRHWVKGGLPVVAGRPVLILGRELGNFLQHRRQQARRSCQSGEMYCMRCRAPSAATPGLVDYQRIGPNRGRFVGLCSKCECLMYRSVNTKRMPALLASMVPGLRLDQDT